MVRSRLRRGVPVSADSGARRVHVQACETFKVLKQVRKRLYICAFKLRAQKGEDGEASILSVGQRQP